MTSGPAMVGTPPFLRVDWEEDKDCGLPVGRPLVGTTFYFLSCDTYRVAKGIQIKDTQSFVTHSNECVGL